MAGDSRKNLLGCLEKESQRCSHLVAQARSKTVIVVTLESETRWQHLPWLLLDNKMLVETELRGHEL